MNQAQERRTCNDSARLPLDAVPLRRGGAACGLEDVDLSAHAGDCLWCSLPPSPRPDRRAGLQTQLQARLHDMAARNRTRQSWVSATLRLEEGSLHIRSPLSCVQLCMDLTPTMTALELLPKLVGVLHLPGRAPDGAPWSYSIRFASDWIVPDAFPIAGLSAQRRLEFFLVASLATGALPR